MTPITSLKFRLFVAGGILLTAIVAATCGGCAHVVTPQGIAAAGGTATGQLQASREDIIAARPHTDPYGQARLDSAKGGIDHVLTTELPALEAAGPALQREQDAHASDLKRDKWVGWQWRIIWRWIVGILAGAAALSIGLALFAGINPVGAWEKAASLIVKLLMFIPNGVSQAVAWYHMHQVKQAQVATAVVNTASLPPDTLTAPPTPAQIKVLKKPKQKGDLPLVRQLNAIPPVIPPTVPSPLL